MFRQPLIRLLVLALSLGRLALASLAAQEIDITQFADPSRLIPLAISGYTGEVNRVLRFDLEIAGFEIVAEEKAAFILKGSNGTQVEGRLTLGAKSMLAKAYTGGTPRSQAHSLADDVVQAATGRAGVARTKIIYKADAGKNSELFMADYDGANPIQVTRDNTIVAAPAWTPGKRLLFYTSYKSGYPDIYSHDLGSGERRVIARYPGLNTSAAVSPDGRKVAMILSKGGSPDLYVCDVDGSNLVQLTRTREDESSPCWSPDGRQICVVSRINERRGLYVIPSSGGTLARLRTDGVLNPTEPDWSPDGKTIVFTSQMGSFNICTIPAAGGTATVLVGGEDPSWAPNSRTVVFTRRVNHKRLLSLLDVPTKRVKDTAQSSGNCSQPCWAK